MEKRLRECLEVRVVKVARSVIILGQSAKSAATSVARTVSSNTFPLYNNWTAFIVLITN